MQSDIENPSKKNQEIAKTMEFKSGSVVFYNVENLFDTEDDLNNSGDDEFTSFGAKFWDDERYFEKLDKISDAIHFNEELPIIIGFAEIENRKVLTDLLKNNQFQQYNYKISHLDSEDNRGIDCGLIYNSDFFELVSETKLKIQLEDDPDFKTRDILYVQGKINETDHLHVFVNHWSSRREGKIETEDRRIAAAKTLRKKIDEILRLEPAAKIIIMGDFNDEPEDQSVYHYLRAKNRKDTQNNDLINLFLSDSMKNNGTIVFNKKWMVFDQLIVSQGLYNSNKGIKIRNNEAKIEENEKLIYTYPDGGTKPNSSFGGDRYFGGFSDHLPVYLILEMN